jgi:hypothetical protein
MDAFATLDTQQTDEGYSEDPLNPSASLSGFLAKPRNDAVWELGAQRPGPEFPEWLTRHIAGLSVQDKTRESTLAFSLLTARTFHLVQSVSASPHWSRS